jgi:uncharacterized membrane protein YgaE (UPF0421/DUF939 family)
MHNERENRIPLIDRVLVMTLGVGLGGVFASWSGARWVEILVAVTVGIAIWTFLDWVRSGGTQG